MPGEPQPAVGSAENFPGQVAQCTVEMVAEAEAGRHSGTCTVNFAPSFVGEVTPGRRVQLADQCRRLRYRQTSRESPFAPGDQRGTYVPGGAPLRAGYRLPDPITIITC